MTNQNISQALHQEFASTRSGVDRGARDVGVRRVGRELVRHIRQAADTLLFEDAP